MIDTRHWVTALVAVAALTSGLGAQGKETKPDASACAMNFEKPGELKDAQSQLAISQLGKGDAQKKALQKAVEKLSRRTDYYSANPVSQAFLLGQALVLWSQVPGEPASVRRGDLGFLGEKDQQITLLKSADSLFTIVEKAMPACADQTTLYRKGPWARLINRVGPLINADKIDSATVALDESMVIYRDSPYTSYFQGQIAYRKDEFSKASEYFEKAATQGMAEMVTDSTIAGITEYSAFFAPYSASHAAATMSGAEQAAAFKRIATLYGAYLKSFHCGSFATNASVGLFEALSSAADTAGLRTVLQGMAAEQRPCSDSWWYTAARDASEADMNELAVQLSDKAVAYSPWSAALGNAGGAYWKSKEWTKLAPIARRLTEVAPNSPDNWQMLALSFQGLSESATTPATKKAYSDSLVTSYNTGEEITVKVRVSEFTADASKRTIAGTLELVDHTPVAPPVPKSKSKAGKGKPAAPPPPEPPPPPKLKPRTVTLAIEFLDRAGKVLTVKDSSGAAVAAISRTYTVSPGERTQFRIVIQEPKAIGYRYAQIPATP